MKYALALLLLAIPAYADNARKTAEAGWNAYQKKDLATAEALTRKALSDPDLDDNVRASALYNLGRILEDEHDKTGAVLAYEESLTRRKNAVVRERLRTLDPKEAAAFDSFVPQSLKGPYTSLLGWCKDFLGTSGIAPENCTDPRSSPRRKPKTPFKLPPPYQDVTFIELYQSYALIVVKVDGKLYVAELHPYEDSGHCHDTTWSFDGVTQRAGVLEVAYRASGFCVNREESRRWRERASTVIGIGPSKQPSGVAMVFDVDEDSALNLVRVPTWSKDGTSVDVAIKESAGEAFEGGSIDSEDIKGHHAFVFPDPPRAFISIVVHIAVAVPERLGQARDRVPPDPSPVALPPPNATLAPPRRVRLLRLGYVGPTARYPHARERAVRPAGDRAARSGGLARLFSTRSSRRCFRGGVAVGGCGVIPATGRAPRSALA